MNWSGLAGVSIALGLALVAAEAGPVGWLVLAGLAAWLWTLG